MKNSAILTSLLVPHITAFLTPSHNRYIPKHASSHFSVKSDVIDINDSSDSLSHDYSEMTTLPRHPTNEIANEILVQTEVALKKMQERELYLAMGEENNATSSKNGGKQILIAALEEETLMEVEQESVYANSYVDLGKVDTVGFDFDYTLVTYTQQLLELIYDMALRRLVNEKEYPSAMLSSGLKVSWFDVAAFERYFVRNVIHLTLVIVKL